MKRLFVIAMVALVLLMAIGCAPASAPTSIFSEPPPETLSDQQVLDRYPDGLESALEELDQLE